VPRGAVLRRSVPPLSSQRITPQGAGLPDWLAPLVGNVEHPMRLIAPDSEVWQLLEKYLGILGHPLTTPRLLHAVVTHIHDLIAVGLGDSGDGAAKAKSSGVKERLEAIKADILENLSSPELTGTAVALRQRVTSRYIRMLFQKKGTTFSKFVLNARLMRAHGMLSDPVFASMKISDIALAVGFNDLSYFDRTFRRQFHASPSELRATRVTGHHRVVSGGRSLSA
jgi:AraC-like DNA-binding protein